MLPSIGKGISNSAAAGAATDSHTVPLTPLADGRLELGTWRTLAHRSAGSSCRHCCTVPPLHCCHRFTDATAALCHRCTEATASLLPPLHWCHRCTSATAALLPPLQCFTAGVAVLLSLLVPLLLHCATRTLMYNFYWRTIVSKLGNTLLLKNWPLYYVANVINN